MRLLANEHPFWFGVGSLLDGRPWIWLARQMGKTGSQLSNMRAREPKLSEIVALANAIGVPVERLLDY